MSLREPNTLVTTHAEHSTGCTGTPGPELYDTSFSWEDGNGIQHGWGGRAQRP